MSLPFKRTKISTVPSMRGKWGFAVLRCWCFFDAVMRWIKSQFAVLRWSQILRCAMFVLFTLRCSVKWNYLRCCGFLCDLFKSSFDEANSRRRQVETKLRHYARLGFGLWSCSATAKNAPLALISANSAMVCLFCGKLFRYRSMTLSVDVKII